MTHYISSYLWSANFIHDQIDINSQMAKTIGWQLLITLYQEYIIDVGKRKYNPSFEKYLCV